MSCQISGAIVTQRVGKCHCSVQRLEEGCHTLYRSLFVWLILTGPIHHCWACWLSLQQNHRKHSNFFFRGMDAHTPRSISSGSLPFLLPCVLYAFYSFIRLCLRALVPRCPSFCAFVILLLYGLSALLSIVAILPFVYIF